MKKITVRKISRAILFVSALSTALIADDAIDALKALNSIVKDKKITSKKRTAASWSVFEFLLNSTVDNEAQKLINYSGKFGFRDQIEGETIDGLPAQEYIEKSIADSAAAILSGSKISNEKLMEDLIRNFMSSLSTGINNNAYSYRKQLSDPTEENLRACDAERFHIWAVLAHMVSDLKLGKNWQSVFDKIKKNASIIPYLPELLDAENFFKGDDKDELLEIMQVSENQAQKKDNKSDSSGGAAGSTKKKSSKPAKKKKLVKPLGGAAGSTKKKPSNPATKKKLVKPLGGVAGSTKKKIVAKKKPVTKKKLVTPTKKTPFAKNKVVQGKTISFASDKAAVNIKSFPDESFSKDSVGEVANIDLRAVVNLEKIQDSFAVGQKDTLKKIDMSEQSKLTNIGFGFAADLNQDTEIIWPKDNTIEELGNYFMTGAKIKEFNFAPFKNLKKIGSSPFYICPNLKVIYVRDEAQRDMVKNKLMDYQKNSISFIIIGENGKKPAEAATKNSFDEKTGEALFNVLFLPHDDGLLRLRLIDINKDAKIISFHKNKYAGLVTKLEEDKFLKKDKTNPRKIEKVDLTALVNLKEIANLSSVFLHEGVKEVDISEQSKLRKIGRFFGVSSKGTTEIKWPKDNNIEEIGEGFMGMNSISEFSFVNFKKLKKIGINLFSRCENLSTIYVRDEAQKKLVENALDIDLKGKVKILTKKA